MRGLCGLVAAVVLCGCAGGERVPPDAAPTPSSVRTEGGELPIYEHERSGHVPSAAIPGTWEQAGRTLELGEVNEVLEDDRPIGTYRAEMDRRLFEVDVAGCRRSMTWSFEEGDLVLTGGGPGCPLQGRWQRL